MSRQVFLMAALFLAAAVSPVPARERPDGFVAMRIGTQAEVPRILLEDGLHRLATEDPNPQHLVVLVHGFDTSLAQSTAQYREISERLRREFSRHGRRVSILGVQWPSDVGAMRSWVPKSLAHHLLRAVGFRKAVRDPYESRVELARPAGEIGLRQILLRLQDRFPATRLHVLAHSLGSEITLDALEPQGGSQLDGESRNSNHPVSWSPFQPERPLRLDLAVLAGADVDHNRELPGITRGNGQVGLYWITTVSPGSSRDRVLVVRKIARGTRALGNAPPKLRQEVIDALIGGRRVVFDTANIPKNHDIRDYYDDRRVADLAETAVTLHHSPPRSPVLRALEEVLSAPAQPEALTELLNRPNSNLTPRLYALWRLEHLLCGDSRHLENGSSLKLMSLALKSRREFEKARAATDCVAVRRGLWPPFDSFEDR